MAVNANLRCGVRRKMKVGTASVGHFPEKIRKTYLRFACILLFKAHDFYGGVFY
jgi:hypothetical protein